METIETNFGTNIALTGKFVGGQPVTRQHGPKVVDEPKTLVSDGRAFGCSGLFSSCGGPHHRAARLHR
jgi:hypothetical protein